MMSKKLFAVWLVILGFCWVGLAAQISLDPLYTEERFIPSDSFHAWCLNEMLVSLKSTAKENISSLRIIVNYDPTAVQILKIKPADWFKNILDTQIESDKIVATVLDAPVTWDATKLFTIAFKSIWETTWTLFAIRKPSYVMSKTAEKIAVFAEESVTFSKVPECEPDSLPPIITLIKPASETGILAIDTYFSFSIKDEAKGVDKNSLRVHFAGQTYTGNDSSLVWSGDILNFYPNTWIPLWKKVDIAIRVADKQIYWWANETKQTFSFQTSTGVLFDQNLTPAMLRILLNKKDSIFASPQECSGIIENIITSKDLSNLASLWSLVEKMWCDFDIATITKDIQTQIKNDQEKPNIISVFAIIWWILFLISFLLKIHYMIDAKKHKKQLSKLSQSS